MNKDLSLWHFIANQLEAGKQVMLLIVTESLGSSPGRAGFKMAIAPDGEMKGSIGGGIMEVKLVELARKKLQDDKTDPLLKKQIHKKDAPRYQSGMICSGEQTIIYFGMDEDDLTEVHKIIRIISEYQAATIHISYQSGLPQFVVEEGIKNKNPTDFLSKGESEFIYKENIGYKYQLYIIGGGHCALALCELISKFDFYIHVIDDRPGLNTMEQNYYAHEKHILEHYEEVDNIVPSGPDVYVVVMTLGYRSDLIVLNKLLGKTFAYLGLLGSEAKIGELKDELLKNGFTQSSLTGLHAPIGLKINSHTPEEIAVSIAAEIIKIKNT